MRYEIKELGIGGVLDQAVVLLKNHFGLLLGVTLVLYIPFGLVQNFVNLALTPELPANPTLEDMMALQREAAANLPITLPLIGVFVLLVVPITNAAVIHAIASEYLEKPTTVGQAMRRAFRVIVPLAWTWFLQTLAIMGGFILCIIPGILFAFWFSLSSHVVVIEGESGFAALGRSKQLMKGNIGTVFVLGILIGLIQWVILIAAAFIPQQHIQVIGQVVAGAIVTIFAAAAFVVFYFSCRCKFENFDLTLLAQSVSVESPAEAEADAAFDE